jgi:hypothetical protein
MIEKCQVRLMHKDEEIVTTVEDISFERAVLDIIIQGTRRGGEDLCQG